MGPEILVEIMTIFLIIIILVIQVVFITSVKEIASYLRTFLHMYRLRAGEPPTLTNHPLRRASDFVGKEKRVDEPE